MYDIAPHMVQEMKHAVTSEKRSIVTRSTEQEKSSLEKIIILYDEQIAGLRRVNQAFDKFLRG